jgi:hypothetical protein
VATRLGFAGDTIPGGALSWVNWVAGLVSVYSAVVSLGAFLTGSAARGALYGIAAAAAFALIMRNLRADERLSASVDSSAGGDLALSSARRPEPASE